MNSIRIDNRTTVTSIDPATLRFETYNEKFYVNISTLLDLVKETTLTEVQAADIYTKNVIFYSNLSAADKQNLSKAISNVCLALRSVFSTHLANKLQLKLHSNCVKQLTNNSTWYSLGGLPYSKEMKAETNIATCFQWSNSTEEGAFWRNIQDTLNKSKELL